MAAWPWKRPHRHRWRWWRFLTITSGTVTNMWAWWAGYISIWGQAVSGSVVNHGGSTAFMTGKEFIRIGTPMPSPTNITATMPRDMTIRGMGTTATVTITTTGIEPLSAPAKPRQPPEAALDVLQQAGIAQDLKLLADLDSLVPARSALVGLRPAMRDKFLSPFPKRLKCPGRGGLLANAFGVVRMELFQFALTCVNLGGGEAVGRDAASSRVKWGARASRARRSASRRTLFRKDVRNGTFRTATGTVALPRAIQHIQCPVPKAFGIG